MCVCHLSINNHYYCWCCCGTAAAETNWKYRNDITINDTHMCCKLRIKLTESFRYNFLTENCHREPPWAPLKKLRTQYNFIKIFSRKRKRYYVLFKLQYQLLDYPVYCLDIAKTVNWIQNYNDTSIKYIVWVYNKLYNIILLHWKFNARQIRSVFTKMYFLYSYRY